MHSVLHFGLLTAGFADRYDRKKLLLFFYTGFIAGTPCAALQYLSITGGARIITGLFGGVIGSISMAIVADFVCLHIVDGSWVFYADGIWSQPGIGNTDRFIPG